MSTSATSSAVRKPTIREDFLYVLSKVEGDERATAFLEGRIAQLDKKNSADRKPTANQVENEGFKQDILKWMEADHLYTSAEIVKGVPTLVEADVKPNRVVALLTQLKNAGQVVTTVDKRKTYYSRA